MQLAQQKQVQMNTNQPATVNKCRVCWMEQGELYAVPCQCAGSIGFIHQICLEKSLYQYIKQNSPNDAGIYQKSCQICKRNIQFKVQKKGYKFGQMQWGIKIVLKALYIILILLSIIILLLRQFYSVIEKGYDNIELSRYALLFIYTVGSIYISSLFLITNTTYWRFIVKNTVIEFIPKLHKKD